MYVYDTTRFAAYRDRWILAADSSIAQLTSHPSSRPDLTFLAEFSGQKTINESEHLACFDGGNFLLAGNVLKRQDYINFGLALTSACHDTYISTATGIGPEVFQWNTSTLPSNQTAFYEKAGFWISDASYDLRPEVIESYYYAYQIVRSPRHGITDVTDKHRPRTPYTKIGHGRHSRRSTHPRERSPASVPSAT